MLATLSSWKQLQQHRDLFDTFSLVEAFKNVPDRAGRFSGNIGPLHVDYSKNLITEETLHHLISLAKQRNLQAHIQNLFHGAVVNHSQQQAAAHVAVRATQTRLFKHITPEFFQQIEETLKHMHDISERIRSHRWLGYDDQAITDVINIGVGGSYLGPYMTTQSLAAFNNTHIRLHFVANQHDAALQRLLKKLNPATTLILVSSKSFSTQETLYNFEQVLNWISTHCSKSIALEKQTIAITSEPEKAKAHGIPEAHILRFAKEIGGRFSVWSGIGLPLCIAIGFSAFKDFLAGAEMVDQHFYHTPLEKNLPVLLALIDLWYIHFFSAHSFAVLPYHQDLYLLPRYLQQLSMESNGKSVTQQNESISYHTGSVLWGGVGVTGQHAYHQLLHQGTAFIPCEFIVTYEEPHLFAQCLAQARALMIGQHSSSPAQNCPGNRPSTIISMPTLNSYHLGAFLALHEHKVFTQAVIWDINPFDQWGVEHGKQLGKGLGEVIAQELLPAEDDGSTRLHLQNYYAFHHAQKRSD